MKYLDEYRDQKAFEEYLEAIHKVVKHDWTIMEICGGQTHSLVKNGIVSILPKQINMVHGPGCPVCVTPISLIDQAIALAEKENIILCSFGDMLRVPGSKKSLLQAKAEGANIRIVYSPLDAVKLAQNNPEKEIVFFAVGFETTAPANGLSVIQAEKLNVANYSILTSHVLVPPAMEAILSDPDNHVQGFLAAGHVCAVMGMDEYYPIVKKYKVPIVVTGFEPVDLLQGIFMIIKQLELGKYTLENQYARVVKEEGNRSARAMLNDVFDIAERQWRGIGEIPKSGYELKSKYSKFDAKKKFGLALNESFDLGDCQAGDILKGIKKPYECPHFGKSCTPENPLGAPMVSSEGACAAYFHYSRHLYKSSSPNEIVA
jgi:hydrogenase expression/formation protein HypD